MIKIYTDGACKGNPGDGGWGALIIDGPSNKEIYGGESNTTNNRMELLAVIKALLAIPAENDITIYTDSTYVQKGISEWIVNWKRNGWKSSNKKPVKNQDLWIKLDTLNNSHSVKWEWVKGHAGQTENERADYLANLGVNSSQE
jgi:ribonuclease HI